MRYHALATDFDGTLAHDGHVTAQTLQALKRLRESGRHLILVTGRRMEELIDTFPEYAIFEIIVAENGGLLHFPADGKEIPLDEAPPERFVELLRERGVTPLASGHVIVATWDPFKEVVLQTIQELGLELHMIFNKGALMVLPSNVNKSSGLRAALDRLCISPHNTVGAGDAENDHSLLALCECAVAVQNAIPSLKEKADLVTDRDHGGGVEELIDHLLRNDLSDVPGRCQILLGTSDDGSEVKMPPYGVNLLVSGTSGGGKSTLTTGVMERLVDSGYQFLAIDPEGDYERFEGAVVLGETHQGPDLTEIMTVLERPNQSAIVNLLGVAMDERPNFFERLFPLVVDMRKRTGRPHWVILDEAHHLLPTKEGESLVSIPDGFCNLMLVTLGPEGVSHEALSEVNRIIAAGEHPEETIRQFCKFAGIEAPHIKPVQLEKGEVVQWKTGDKEAVKLCVAPSRSQRTRHRRKYAEGELTADRSFFFRGPKNQLNLRAQNLKTFIQIMDGVDDETWLHHLRHCEYSNWFRENIKNGELADEAARLESTEDISAAESRKRMKQIIDDRYALPA